MTKTWRSLIPIAVLAVVSVPLSAQTKMGKEFLIDVNSPFVYVKFDHIGPGAPRNPSEPNSRVWLRLRNNCRIAIIVRANGVPDDSPKNEVGLEYDVAGNPPVRGLVELPNLLNSRQLKFCLSAVGIFGFLAFESSREALKDRSEDEVRHTD
jgi:hypothetical protein